MPKEEEVRLVTASVAAEIFGVACWLDIESPLDYLGMDISQDDEFIYLSMTKYIDTALDLLGWTNIKPVSTPLREAIDPDSEGLNLKI